jgi:hypothetical protein
MANILSAILPNAVTNDIRSDADQVALTGLMFLKLDARPNIAGTDAPVGSLAVFDNDTTAELWLKTTTSSTSWVRIAVP